MNETQDSYDNSNENPFVKPEVVNSNDVEKLAPSDDVAGSVNSEVPEDETDAERETKFMDLGAPKDNRNVHVENLLLQGHPSGHYHVNKDIDIDPIRRVFRITIQPHTKRQYIFWAVCSVIVGISLVSFITESALLVSSKLKNTFFSNGVPATTQTAQNLLDNQNPNNVQNVNTNHNSSTSNTAENNIDTTHQATLATSSIADSDSGTSTNFVKEYFVPEKAKIPNTGALAYLVGDIKTGEIIIQKNPDAVYPLASVSKLMTALVANQNMDLKKTATVSRDSYNTFGAEGNLVLGEKLKLSDLMFPLLMESSNDGAEVIADEYGRPEFMQLMNKTAAILNMPDTYYEDPSGLNPKNSSTVVDQFRLGRYIYTKYPSIFDYTRVKIYEVGKHTWHNRNAMLNFDSFVGGKNGYIDESRQTLVALFNIPLLKGGDRTIAVVILKSPDRTTDTVNLLGFLKKFATYIPKEIQDVSKSVSKNATSTATSTLSGTNK